MVELSDEQLEQLKTSIPKEVGNRVRFFRKKRGITQTQLAQLVGKDRQYLYKIEKGVVTPNVVTISILALTLEVPLKDFFDIEI
ncbi:helix-turn-helix transcriptional regulator [Algibacter sp. L4_22]|uniref:helix-turn-helix transcriptional regulator n=1 Tax=Algibacter sp. L4_22 TaxID=2942477 RepID=UPI00201B79A9|nr:helix-turn-helix transcriptional regulator [Algibacter sp. L4_22]MCL5127119.1 helix-turn-helix domain-containing protein [Algibacter sp. L4_22]